MVKKQCRFVADGDCSKCPDGTPNAKKNQWVGICTKFIGEDDCTAC
jgi:hypothetical protein